MDASRFLSTIYDPASCVACGVASMTYHKGSTFPPRSLDHRPLFRVLSSFVFDSGYDDQIQIATMPPYATMA